ncbi:DNA-directed RNA polymerase subunit omega [candidate division KSB1 bacterium]|nr:DNA-directed RNA polymerase subunit omega [candidate division KSB1 bacterium]MBL7094485.1 DNA-directed RNA polymerase subunit omega [candidate division KSB1 bacterium]
MGSTLSLEDLVKHSDNIYEAIIILGKRANQINEDQKVFIEREAGIDDSYDNDDEDDYNDRDMLNEGKKIRLPKPTSMAIEEFISGKLQYDYGDDVEGEAAQAKE